MFDYYEARDENEISKFTDLAIERRRADETIPGVELTRRKSRVGTWETVKITSEEGERSIGRPRGIYATLSVERMDNLTEDEMLDSSDELARELCEICDANRIIPARILVVGLGNRALTPDSIGPRAAERVYPTMQIMKHDNERFFELDCSEIAVIVPGVSGKSGIDASDMVAGVISRIKPDVIFAVDALASRSPDRLGRTVQVSDTGIFPGSGVGNTRGEISKKSLGTPVIAIGVPTVIDSRHFSKNGFLTGEPMFVSPREIDGICENAAAIIGGAINQAFGIFE